MLADTGLMPIVHAVQAKSDPVKLLESIPEIVLAIEAAATPEEISGIRGMVRTFHTYLKETLPGVMADRNEALTHLHKTSVLWIEASAKAGAIWKDFENRQRHGGDRKSDQAANSRFDFVTWYEAGFKSDKDVTRCVRAAELDESDRWQYYEECRINSKEPSMNGIENVWREFRNQIILSSESNEWYTPAMYVEAARRVMGGIDTDPASNDFAQATIQAQTYYTIEDSGLQYDWHGRIWLNPPYGDLCPLFVSRLLEQYLISNVTEAVLLVNSHATETNWFAPLWDHTLCFTDHRINFISPDGAKNGSTHGSVFVYLGHNPRKFYEEFKQFGYVVRRVHDEYPQP